MAEQKKLKRISPAPGDNPALNRNFEIIGDNFTELFKRNDRLKYVIGASNVTYSLTQYNVFEQISALEIKLDCVAFKPVFVFLTSIKPTFNSTLNFSYIEVNGDATKSGAQIYITAVGPSTIHTIYSTELRTADPVGIVERFTPNNIWAFFIPEEIGLQTFKIYMASTVDSGGPNYGGVVNCRMAAIQLL